MLDMAMPELFRKKNIDGLCDPLVSAVAEIAESYGVRIRNHARSIGDDDRHRSILHDSFCKLAGACSVLGNGHRRRPQKVHRQTVPRPLRTLWFMYEYVESKTRQPEVL